jgi:hypothetical protein
MATKWLNDYPREKGQIGGKTQSERESKRNVGNKILMYCQY